MVTDEASVMVGWYNENVAKAAVVIWVVPVTVVVAAETLRSSNTADVPEVMVRATLWMFWLVKVWEVPNPATVSEAEGKVNVWPSAPAAKAMVLAADKVF